VIVRTFTESHLGGNDTGEELIRNRRQPLFHAPAQRFANIDLMPRDSDIHALLR
jgi:hypothetical protein